MKNEIFWLALILLQTVLMFVPYVLNLFYRQGLLGALRYYQTPKTPLSDWAQKAQAAHKNAIDNLVILAPASLAYIILAGPDRPGDGITLYLQIYFFARLAHYLVYALRLNYIRTVFFFVGFISTLCIIWEVISLTR